MRSLVTLPAEELAPKLLGHELIRIIDGRRLVGIITETEAYLGEHDPGSHVTRGETPRTKALYGSPGHAYIYKMHMQYLLNISVDKEHPGCVLIRGILPVEGEERMREFRYRGFELPFHEIANGPGKLCQALDITLDLYGVDLTDQSSELHIAEGPAWNFDIEKTKRIGITKAANWKLRFVIPRESQKKFIS